MDIIKSLNFKIEIMYQIDIFFQFNNLNLKYIEIDVISFILSSSIGNKLHYV